MSVEHSCFSMKYCPMLTALEVDEILAIPVRDEVYYGEDSDC